MAAGKKNRKWVVRAIVSFVAILALLTFFSNTIMNATIPKVIGQNAVRGNLSSTNSATGTITPDLKTDIKSIANREIDHVLVGNYYHVDAGDPLVSLKPLEEGEDEALETLRDQLQTAERAQRDYEMSPAPDNSFTTEQSAIDLAQDNLDTANATLDAARNRDSVISDAEDTIDTYSSQVPGLQATVDAEAASVADYNASISEIEADITSTQTQIDTLINLGVPTPTPVPETPEETLPTDETTETSETSETTAAATDPRTDTIAELQAQLEALEAQRDATEALRDEAQARMDSASADLAEAQAEIADAEATITAAEQLPSVSDAQTAVNRAQTSLDSARTSLSNAQAQANVTAAQTADAVADRLELIEELEEKIAKAEEAAAATEIVAPISGTVYSLAVSDGEKMEEDKVIMVIIPPESTYSVTFSFDADVASTFDTGTELTPNDGYIEKCIVTNVHPDERNPREKRIVKCAIEGYDIWPGLQLTVTAGRSNADYEHVIPCSAVGEDNAGTYVYVIIESSGPLGDKYVVRRVSVTVDKTDGTLCAISGDGIDQGMIVTRSEKPLHNGDRVRLEDYSSDQS